jgi:hypothetical protein
MRKLELEEIERFASRQGVRRIAVENFLMSMGTDEGIAMMNLGYDRAVYRWNCETVGAIRDGIRLASG